MTESSDLEQRSAEEQAQQERLVKRCGQVDRGALRHMLEKFGLRLHVHEPDACIPGSYWGEPEAGIQGFDVHIRDDTPVHSLLHEAGHVICMDAERRANFDTEAGGEDVEENGVCYLQILLADYLPGVGRDRLMLDMDRWGYSFRMGSTRLWFEQDADDARLWLIEHGLVQEGTADGEETVLWRLRS